MAKKDEPNNPTPNEQPPIPPAAASDPARDLSALGQEAASRATSTAAATVRDLADSTARAARQATQQAGRAAAGAAAGASDAQHTLLGLPAEAYRSLADTSRADLDAVIQSGARLAQGFQDLSWEMTQFSQRSVERGMQWANDMMDCRSFEDLLSRQRDFMRDSVDAWLSESARLLSLSSRLADDAANPISSRLGQQTGALAARQ